MIRALLLVAGVALLGGCGGGGGDPTAIMRETAANLGKIRSAKEMTFRLSVDPRGDEEFGFAINGAVALCDKRPLPVLDVAYTKFAQGDDATVQVISTGQHAFFEVDDQAYAFSDQQEADLRHACDDLSTEGGGLEVLRVDDWVEDADADGADDVHGDLDVVAVINDLVDVARAFRGSRLSRLDADDARRIAEATHDSSFELERDGEDKLLRRLFLEADLGFDVPAPLRRQLDDVVGAKITFELELDGVNEQIEIEAPENPKPASELPNADR